MPEDEVGKDRIENELELAAGNIINSAPASALPRNTIRLAMENVRSQIGALNGVQGRLAEGLAAPLAGEDE